MAGSVTVEIKRLDPGMDLPVYQRAGDAGMDLASADDLVLGPGERALVSTGIAVAIPDGYVGLTTPRSGLAVRTGLSIVNTPGVIDSGYRGELKVCLVNHDPEAKITVRRGDRIAQLLIMPVSTATLTEVEDLGASDRGAGGFGSTGI